LSLAGVARQVLCTNRRSNRRFYEPIPNSDESNPALDCGGATATPAADRDAGYSIAGAAFGEAGLLERVARRHGCGRELAAIPSHYKRGLRL
jgi:hypothetical protein